MYLLIVMSCSICCFCSRTFFSIVSRSEASVEAAVWAERERDDSSPPEDDDEAAAIADDELTAAEGPPRFDADPVLIGRGVLADGPPALPPRRELAVL